jgi:hypothetical protein
VIRLNRGLLVLLAAFATLQDAYAGDIVVIVNNAADAPSKAEVADVYLGRSRAFTPIDLIDTPAFRADFYQRATGRDLAQVKSVWSRIVFTGKGQPPQEMSSAAAVKKAVAADLKGIGYIDKSALDNTVKAAIDLN